MQKEQIPIVSVEQMREIDRKAIEDYHISVIQLMENAGRTTADFIIERFHPTGTVSILAGSGNNGGDGLVAARHLKNRGYEVEIILTTEQLKEPNDMQLRITRRMGIPEKTEPSKKATLLVDALLGYGATGAPYGRIADIIAHANSTKLDVVAIDIPSGFELTSGQWFFPAFENVAVLALALPKHHMIDNPRIDELYVGDIGIPEQAYLESGIPAPPLFREKSFIRID